ncbi:MAG TPA: Mo-dependent nitrogenase C-terminal domain-containing protein [Oscillatoriales cyanobacterium M59_W2019_021]|nr:MAG: nitrogenase [Cyanobacteria bacterium J055]HIK32825.1 Mo-dependent nitrogenase C-terminal domain-containing protein [Oscillatoriales cyanobacterium M4454_W2019_049]HIK51816.1 Mo-dependent nitrogenase C-terminal domain-containing protein [Oscillatoriales cyanobacterium M59_W2019_021]
MQNLGSHWLQPIRQWLDTREIRDRNLALFLSKAIPSQCPFARDINLFGRRLLHIPPLCKLNPFYDQLVGLRFRALCYLVDDCGMNFEAFS